MKVLFAGLTNVGKRREKNEDSFVINQEFCHAIVADGMGGHLGGDIASRSAVETIDSVLAALEKDPEMTLEEGMQVSPGDYASHLRYAISQSSARIYEKSQEERKLKGMGTTAVVLLLRNNKAYVANVGDSRAYRIRDNAILQVTEDHSLVGEQIRAGFLSQNDARAHRLKNIITRSVGFQETVEPDIVVRAAKTGDQYLLCSDGLTNLVEDHEIRDIVLHNAPHISCQRLVDIANERGGDDNITVVIAKVEVLGKDGDEDATLEAD